MVWNWLLQKQEAKKSITISPVAKFEVDDDWADELPKDEPIKELKQKLKAQKRAIKSQSTWTTTLMEGETEIVIPNKKYKGAVPLKPAPEVGFFLFYSIFSFNSIFKF